MEDLQKSWTQLTDYGTEVHKLFESVINPEIEYTPKLLNEEQVSLLQNQLRDFIEDTKEKFGRDCKFITEIPIVSEDIAEPYKAAGLNSINGRIDLLIVDKNGNAHIRDFKVSRKAVGAWDETRNALLNNVWASTKKLGAAYQLNFYKAMLEQQGINVATVGIIPLISLKLLKNLWVSSFLIMNYLQKFKGKTQTLNFIRKNLFNMSILQILMQSMENIDFGMNSNPRILQKASENMRIQKRKLIKN